MLAWLPILAIVSFTAVGLLAKQGAIVRWGYPAGSFLVAAWLFVRYPALYLGFTWWVWFLSPFVRRVADSQAGWLEPNPVLLAPFLTTLLTLVTLVQYFPRICRWGGFPFILSLVSVLYGLLVGLTQFPAATLIVPTLNWITPILFGLHLFTHWRQYPQHRAIVQRSFLWATLVMGAYGVYQYLVAPAWDCLWLSNQQTLVFGYPEPRGIRVFSTMNSPQPFACTLAAGLILLFTNRGKVRFLSASAGYLAFLLTLARSAWLGWMVGIALLIPALKQRLQTRLVVSLLVIAVLVMPLAAVEPFSSAIGARVQSIFNLQQDVSFNARAEGYSDALGLALTEVTGQGLGGSIISDALGQNDSGILSLLFLLGWFGTIPYMGGLTLLLLGITYKLEATDPFAASARSIALGTFVQIGLNEAMVGVFGIVLWGFLGLALAAQRYHWHERQQSLQQMDNLPPNLVRVLSIHDRREE